MIARNALVLVALAGAAGTAAAQTTITLFGQNYEVQRFNYSDEVLLPNAVFPEDGPIPFIESEGIVWLGNDKVLMSADDIFDISPGNADNWIVEVRLNRDAQGRYTGLSYNRTIVAVDSNGAFDYNPSGLTLNTGSTGLGGGGNVVMASGGGNFFAFSLQSPSLGQLLSPAGGLCTGSLGTCRISLGTQNTNLEDVTYVPGGNGAFFAVNQDTVSVERWAVSPSGGVSGQLLGTFPIGSGIPTGPALYAPKGIMYMPDVAAVPAPIRRPGGSIMVAFDDLYPSLQAFDLEGNVLGVEYLTTDQLPGGPSRLDLTGCGDPISIESMTIDPATGTIFLSNQGALTFCNYLWILTPIAGTPPCGTADFDNDGDTGTDADIEAFFSCLAGNCCPSCGTADFDNDGDTGTDADIEAFFRVLAGASC